MLKHDEYEYELRTNGYLLNIPKKNIDFKLLSIR